MNRLLIVVTALTIVGAAIADDLVPPPWRIPGEPLPPGATFQEWTFDADPTDPVADRFDNPFGTPAIVVPATPYPRFEDFDGRHNVIKLGEGVDIRFRIPNVPNAPPDHFKIAWLQFTWKAVPDGPLPGPVPPPGGSAETISTMGLADGWTHSTFKLVFPDCPPEEIIGVANFSSSDIFLDQVVIDTLCVPEPATMAGIGLGLLALMRRKRKN